MWSGASCQVDSLKHAASDSVFSSLFDIAYNLGSTITHPSHSTEVDSFTTMRVLAVNCLMSYDVFLSPNLHQKGRNKNCEHWCMLQNIC